MVIRLFSTSESCCKRLSIEWLPQTIIALLFLVSCSDAEIRERESSDHTNEKGEELGNVPVMEFRLKKNWSIEDLQVLVNKHPKALVKTVRTVKFTREGNLEIYTEAGKIFSPYGQIIRLKLIGEEWKVVEVIPYET